MSITAWMHHSRDSGFTLRSGLSSLQIETRAQPGKNDSGSGLADLGLSKVSPKLCVEDWLPVCDAAGEGVEPKVRLWWCVLGGHTGTLSLTYWLP